MKKVYGIFAFTCLVVIILSIVRQDWGALPFAILGLFFNVGSMLMEDK